MIKVAFISHSSDLSGAPRSLLLLLARIDLKQYNPIVICPAQGLLVDKFNDLGIRVVIVNRVKSKKCEIGLLKKCLERIGYIIRLIKVLYKEKPDLVYVNTIAYASPIVTAWLCSLPIIVHVRESYSYFAGAKRKVRLFPILNFPKHFIAVSQATKEILIEHGVPKHKISVVYNGIDMDEFRSNIEEREQCRKELGLNKNEILAGSIGQIDPRKGMIYFVEAANIVKRKMPDNIKFVIIGGIADSDYFLALKNLSSKYGLDRHFIFTGFKENIARYFAAIDIFVNPTLEEPFARVNLEAMAMGKPVIATDVGGNPEIIYDGETGFLVPAKDQESLARKIMELATNRELRQQFGEVARKRVESNFTAGMYYKNIEPILKKVVKKGNQIKLKIRLWSLF